MHLIHDPWLPVTKSDGSRARIRPCELVQQTVVDVDAPRADLAIAARTFLIGLVTTAGLANNEGDWQRLYDSPPTADALMASLQRYERAFQLLGDGPRFCQHQAVVQDDDWLRIASILIDGPNKESDDRNHDVMTDIVAFSPAIAALSLYALQQLAPSGGRGHRQSMRGGSPMSTLVAGGSTLWHAIWLNVETRDQLAARSPKQWLDRADVADIFPWMGKVRTSENGLETTTSDAHPLQVYWQMPRLLWLDAGAGGADRCGLTGEGSNVLVRGFYRAPRGINYSADWRHPHMPHVRGKDGIQPARAFSRASRVGDWLGVVYRDQNGDREPAAVVTAATTHRVWTLPDASPRVDVFGIEMRSAKVLGAFSHVMPIIAVQPDHADELRAVVERCVLSVERVADMLFKLASGAAIGPETSDAGRKIATFEADGVKTAFLTAMERHVEARIRAAAVDIRDGSFDAVAHAHALHGHIRHEAEAAFDAHLPTDTWARGIERRVTKRWELAQLLRGANRAGAELFAILQIPTPETTKEVMNAT